NARGFLTDKLVSAVEEDKPVFTLEVIVLDDKTARVWLGPLKGLKFREEKELLGYLKKRYRGDFESGYSREIKARNFNQLMADVQEALIPIKRSFPSELNA